VTDAFDLEAAALSAEAEAAPFRFTYKGEEYVIPPNAQWPVSAVAAITAGELREALPELLGKDNARKLLDAGLTLKAMDILFEQAGKQQVGADSLPNSGPPARRGSTRT
jgi:hypothetical protein